MSRHTFAELVRVFFALRQLDDEEMTQSRLARVIGVAGPTLNNWFTGRYAPRSPADIERLARALQLTALEADVLLHSVNPAWVKYQTPAHVLDAYEVNRYWERLVPDSGVALSGPPTIAQIETSWPTYFQDSFESNGNHWGLGSKDDGVCMVERSIADGCYRMRLHNHFYWMVTLGGDSHCFAPPTYYLSVEAVRLSGNKDTEDGIGLLFDEVSDASHGLFRIQDRAKKVSIFVTRNGGDHSEVYVKSDECAAINPQKTNKLAILAMHERHWFYVNNLLVHQAVIPRLPHTRLDVAITSGSSVPVEGEFRDFRVRVPARHGPVPHESS
jgi:transcriptional regulator with XRE-family HTH domain